MYASLNEEADFTHHFNKNFGGETIRRPCDSNTINIRRNRFDPVDSLSSLTRGIAHAGRKRQCR